MSRSVTPVDRLCMCPFYELGGLSTRTASRLLFFCYGSWLCGRSPFLRVRIFVTGMSFFTLGGEAASLLTSLLQLYLYIVETILSGYAGPIVETVVPQQAVVMATHPLCLRS